MNKIKKGLAGAMALLLSAGMHAAIIGGVMYASGAFVKNKSHEKPDKVKSAANRYVLLPDVEIISDASFLKNGEKPEKQRARKEEFGTEKSEAQSGGDADKSVFMYKDAVKRRIQEARLYPEDARKEGTQGVAEVSFVILPDGSLKEIYLMKSSGREILDKEAVSTIKRASPFPAFEEKVNGGGMDMQVAIIFRLN